MNFTNNDFMGGNFFKQFTANQNLISDQIQKAFKTSEEYSKKAVSAYASQVEDMNERISKTSEMFGTIEENNKKIQSFFADFSKNAVDQKSMQEQLKQLETGFQTAYKAYTEQLEKNISLVADKMVAKTFEDSVNSAQNAIGGFSKYLEEQMTFFINFQKELVSVMGSKDSIKEVPGTIAKYSQELMENNSKNVLSGVKTVLEANNKAVAEGVKNVLEINSKAAPVAPAKASKKSA